MLHLFTLTWNKRDYLKRLMDSLVPALHDLDYIWHVKDNGSIDGSVEELNSWNNSHINVVDYKNNKDNYSQGMNFLFDLAAPSPADYIMTLNNDIVIQDPLSIKKMISIMENDNTVGQVGAKLNFVERTDRIQHSGVLFHPYNKLPYHHRSGKPEEVIDRKNRIYPAVTGAISLTTAEIYGKVRHDPKLVWSFDDIDFSLGVSIGLGKKIVYCGETHILHEESASLKKNPIHKMFMEHNARHLHNKWRRHIITDYNSDYLNNPNYAIYKVGK